MSTIATLSVISILYFFLRKNHQCCKRMISITLSTFLLLTCFAGCSSNTGNGKISFHEHTATSAPTCTTGAYCSCGQMIEAPLGHDYAPCTCIDPETCTRCGHSTGIYADHDFSEGFCLYCGIRDRNYFNPYEYGFYECNNDLWISVNSYNGTTSDFTYACFKNSKYSNNHGHTFFEFKNNVLYQYMHSEGTQAKELYTTYSYQLVSNDCIKADGVTFTIIDRIIDDDGNLVLKIMLTNHPYSSDSTELWVVLAEQVDWEKSPEVSGDKEIFYFK